MRPTEAGRDLDALVAEKVMGLHPGVDFGDWPDHVWKLDEDGEIDEFGYDGDRHNGPSCSRCGYGYCQHCQSGPSESCEIAPEPYSTNIAAAWQVVGEMQRRKQGLTLIEYDTSRKYWTAAFRHWSDHAMPERAKTAPLAICRAALAAVASLSETSAAPATSPDVPAPRGPSDAV